MIEGEFSALSSWQHTLEAMVHSMFEITGSCGLYTSAHADSR